MDESKRKQLEMQLRQLISAAANETKPERPDSRPVTGRIQVIRRRKGRPDRMILEAQGLSE
jgi:hypothetical protein